MATTIVNSPTNAFNFLKQKEIFVSRNGKSVRAAFGTFEQDAKSANPKKIANIQEKQFLRRVEAQIADELALNVPNQVEFQPA